jgi:hypothetical protein
MPGLGRLKRSHCITEKAMHSSFPWIDNRQLLRYIISLLSYIYSAARISCDSLASPDLWCRMRSPASSLSHSKPCWRSHTELYVGYVLLSDLEYWYKQCIDEIEKVRREISCGICYSLALTRYLVYSLEKISAYFQFRSCHISYNIP